MPDFTSLFITQEHKRHPDHLNRCACVRASLSQKTTSAIKTSKHVCVCVHVCQYARVRIMCCVHVCVYARVCIMCSECVYMFIIIHLYPEPGRNGAAQVAEELKTVAYATPPMEERRRRRIILCVREQERASGCLCTENTMLE